MWVEQRLQITEKVNYALIKSRVVKCELCTSLLPSQILVGEEVLSLYQFPSLKFDQFLILEDKDGMMYILDFTRKKEFTIGRGNVCHIKLSEITVSREHMRIEVEELTGRIKLFDVKSKFGTLV